MTKNSTTTSNYSRRQALRLMALGGAAGLIAPNLLGKPAFAKAPAGGPAGRVVVGLSQEPTVFNPLMAHIEVDDAVHFSVFDALVRMDAKGVSSPIWPPRFQARRTAAFRRTVSTGASG